MPEWSLEQTSRGSENALEFVTDGSVETDEDVCCESAVGFRQLSLDMAEALRPVVKEARFADVPDDHAPLLRRGRGPLSGRLARSNLAQARAGVRKPNRAPRPSVVRPARALTDTWRRSWRIS